MSTLRIILSGITSFCLAAGLAGAQQTGGWRRATDPPPAPEAQAPARSAEQADAYGQTQTQSAPPAAVPQNNPSQSNQPMYGIPQQLTLRPGTFVTVRVEQMLSSDRNQEGDVFAGTLVQPIVVDGIVVAQRGQTVYGRVAEARKAGRAEGVSHLGLELTGVTLVDGSQEQMRSQLVNRTGRTSNDRDAGTIIGTTAVGAAIGAAADWGRGAAIGAGAGAAAGIIGVLLTRGHPTVVYPETILTFQTSAPLTISTLRAPQAFRYVDPNEYDRPVAAAAPRPRPRPAPVYGPVYGPYPYPYPYYGPYYGPGVGVGVVVVGRGRWHRW